MAEGRKDDTGKDPWELVPYDALSGIVQILKFGAKKYEPRNWENGMDWSRVYGALMRHMTAWWLGEKKDAETGYSHLWHAGCCIMFLIAYEMRGVGKDDRPVSNAPNQALKDAAIRYNQYYQLKNTEAQKYPQYGYQTFTPAYKQFMVTDYDKS